MKRMKQLVWITFFASLIALLLTGCGTSTNTSSSTTSNASSTSSKQSYPTSITVYMPKMYVDPEVLRDFEKEYNVRIILKEFESNEEMYDNVIKPNDFDILVPSDYMIDQLIQEGLLALLDHRKITNMRYIDGDYLNLEFDSANAYHVPYMTGTVGILYNRRTLQISSWHDLFATKGFLMLDSERDIIGIGLIASGNDMNSVGEKELNAAKEVLKDARQNARGYYESEVIADMIAAQEAFAGVVYSGDGKTATDRISSLAYIVPEEGSNRWTDAFVIPIDSRHVDIAHDFINFMCRPNIAIRNMTIYGYTSPVREAWGEFQGDKIMFPSSEPGGDLDRCGVYRYSPEIVERHQKLWKEIRGGEK